MRAASAGFTLGSPKVFSAPSIFWHRTFWGGPIPTLGRSSAASRENPMSARRSGLGIDRTTRPWNLSAFGRSAIKAQGSVPIKSTATD